MPPSRASMVSQSDSVAVGIRSKMLRTLCSSLVTMLTCDCGVPASNCWIVTVWRSTNDALAAASRSSTGSAACTALSALVISSRRAA